MQCCSIQPTDFPHPEGIFLAVLGERSRMRRPNFLMANGESKSSTLVKDAKDVPRGCSALGERSGDLTQLHRTFTWVSIFSYSPGNFLNVPGWKSPKWFVVIHELPSFEPQVSHVLTSSVTPDFRWMWGCGGSTKKGKTNLYQKWILAVLWHHPWSQQG